MAPSGQKQMVHTIKKLPIFNGRYPYYVEVEHESEINKLENASKIFKKLNISWQSILTDKGAEILKNIAK